MIPVHPWDVPVDPNPTNPTFPAKFRQSVLPSPPPIAVLGHNIPHSEAALILPLTITVQILRQSPDSPQTSSVPGLFRPNRKSRKASVFLSEVFGRLKSPVCRGDHVQWGFTKPPPTYPFVSPVVPGRRSRSFCGTTSSACGRPGHSVR